MITLSDSFLASNDIGEVPEKRKKRGTETPKSHMKKRASRLRVDTDNGLARFYRKLSQILADRLYVTLREAQLQEVIEHHGRLHTSTQLKQRFEI